SRSPRNGKDPDFREAKQNSSMLTSMTSELPFSCEGYRRDNVSFYFAGKETGINKEMSKEGGANKSLPCWECSGGLSYNRT
ncbi:hypothetical protein ACQP3L_33935, partial [Escherichia coli]